MNDMANSIRTGPDDRGHFGIFGGRYVAETLMPLILDLEQEYKDAKNDPGIPCRSQKAERALYGPSSRSILPNG